MTELLFDAAVVEMQPAQGQNIQGICKNCCHFDAGEHEPEGDDYFGLCRKSAPKASMIAEMNLPETKDGRNMRCIRGHVFGSADGEYPDLQFFTEPIWPKVYEDDFCGKFKCASWVRRRDQQGRLLLPIKVFHPNHPDYRKLFPGDEDE